MLDDIGRVEHGLWIAVLQGVADDGGIRQCDCSASSAGMHLGPFMHGECWSPVNLVFQTATQDSELHNTIILGGSYVMSYFSSAN